MIRQLLSEVLLVLVDALKTQQRHAANVVKLNNNKSIINRHIYSACPALYIPMNEVLSQFWLQLKKSQKFPTTSVDYFSLYKITFERL